MTHIQSAATTNKAERLKHILIAWLIFSTLYWIAAYYKPYHVDEFYSWVYAERCTFKEIVCLKDFGIGHPPLFHLFQKAVQSILPTYHPTHVRLANYLFGSAFVMLLVSMLSQFKNIPFFYYGFCSSAGLLNAFVFSRMWGLVCLSSLLLLWIGEKYVQNASMGRIALFFGAFILGIAADYSFIIILPYMLLVLSSRKSYLKHLPYTFLISLIATWVLSNYLYSYFTKKSISYFMYSLINSLTLFTYETGVMLFNYWFQEPFILALIVLLLSYWLPSKNRKLHIDNRKNSSASYFIISLLIIPIILEIFIMYDLLRVRHVAPILIVLLIIAGWSIKKSYPIKINSIDKRLAISLACAMLIILSVNPFFWRTIIDDRFVIVLLPFILLLIYRNFRPKTLYTLSVIYLLSGLLYISSNGVSDYYPPPSFEKDMPLVYEDEFAYSTQYLHNRNHILTEPYIRDLSQFKEFCRICSMGTDEIPFDSFDQLLIVGKYDFDLKNYIPSPFVLSRKDDVNLTWSDRFQFRYFTPIYIMRRYTVFEYKKISSAITNFGNLG